MKQYLFLSLLLIVLYSCGNTDQVSKDVTTNSRPLTPFQKFIGRFRTISLPFNYSSNLGDEYYIKRSFKVRPNSTDTLFYKTDGELPVYGYGMLADTSNVYSLIFFETGESYYPVLATYSKDGKQLSSQGLIVRGCGSDCGLIYCSYSAHIQKDLSFYLADTVKYEGMCDENGKYNPDSDSTFIYSKTGSIGNAGQIIVSEEKEQRNKGAK